MKIILDKAYEYNHEKILLKYLRTWKKKKLKGTLFNRILSSPGFRTSNVVTFYLYVIAENLKNPGILSRSLTQAVYKIINHRMSILKAHTYSNFHII